MVDRKSIGKGLRYDVFERDGFTCQYCGQQPPDITLVIDHIIPVAEGGGNEVDNLRTACQPCNAGKSAKLPTSPVTNESDRLRRAQEAMEALALAESAKSAREARKALREEATSMLGEFWTGDYPGSLVSLIVNRIREAGAHEVYGWLEHASSIMDGDTTWDRIGRYVSGCARSWREQQEVE